MPSSCCTGSCAGTLGWHPKEGSALLTCVGVSADGVVVGRERQRLVVGGAGDSRIDVELIDDELGAVPPAWPGRNTLSGRQL